MQDTFACARTQPPCIHARYPIVAQLGLTERARAKVSCIQSAAGPSARDDWGYNDVS